jgi:hypothetical protein
VRSVTQALLGAVDTVPSGCSELATAICNLAATNNQKRGEFSHHKISGVSNGKAATFKKLDQVSFCYFFFC